MPEYKIKGNVLKDDKFTVSIPTRLKYCYLESSSSIARGKNVPTVQIPDNLNLNYVVNITFAVVSKTKIGEKRYLPIAYYATGKSPWRWHKSDDVEQSICTTAVEIGAKVVTSENDLERMVDELLTAAESCCLPDLQVNIGDAEIYKEICNFVKNSQSSELDWSVKTQVQADELVRVAIGNINKLCGCGHTVGKHSINTGKVRCLVLNDNLCKCINISPISWQSVNGVEAVNSDIEDDIEDEPLDIEGEPEEAIESEWVWD